MNTAFQTIEKNKVEKKNQVSSFISSSKHVFNSQGFQKNVNKNCMKIFSLAKNLFNIVMGKLFSLTY